MKLATTPLFVLLPLVGFGCVRTAAGQELRERKPAMVNISYGPDRLNVLDFWPAEGEGPRPLLVYIHGGSWIGGDKKQAEAKFRPFLDKGISCAAINYRLTGKTPLPAPVHDAARAIQLFARKPKTGTSIPIGSR